MFVFNIINIFTENASTGKAMVAEKSKKKLDDIVAQARQASEKRGPVIEKKPSICTRGYVAVAAENLFALTYLN